MTFTKRSDFVPVINRKKPSGAFNTLFGLIEARQVEKRCSSCGEVKPLENYYVKSSKYVGLEPDLTQPSNYREPCIPCYDEKYT